MQANITCLVLDEYRVVRWALRNFLEENGIDVVGEAQTIDETIELVQLYSPDILVSEITFSDGLLADRLAELRMNNGPRVILFSECNIERHIFPLLTAGAAGFVSKREPVENIIAAVRSVAAGHRWISGTIGKKNASASKEGKPQLSTREREIVTLVAEGFTSRQIADRLFISTRTVENHRHRIFKKLRITHCTQLADYAVRNGLRK